MPPYALVCHTQAVKMNFSATAFALLQASVYRQRCSVSLANLLRCRLIISPLSVEPAQNKTQPLSFCPRQMLVNRHKQARRKGLQTPSLLEVGALAGQHAREAAWKALGRCV